MSPLWLFLWLIVIYFFIHALEKTWGDFPFTFFCCLGGATAATGALILDQPTGNSLFFTGLFLAFARLNPEMEVLLFFVLPVRMKWLAVITWFFLATQALFGGLVQLATIAAGLGHYLAFFGQFHWAELKHLWRQSRR